jgi:tRNA-specific 2-thiouridylase
MTQEQLGSTLFPVGDITKEEVRRIATELGLKVADKKESQEICFIDGDYGEFISKKYESKVGDIVDSSGNIVGRHKGLFRYTIGQRRGLDIKDGGGPYYVLGSVASSNTLVVGKDAELFSNGLIARELNWISGNAPQLTELTVKIRYRHVGIGAVIENIDSNKLRVVFKEPQRSVTPGQAVVFYDNDIVLGGGWIEKAID